MELIELGLSSWFKDLATELTAPGHALARVTVVDRGQYTIRNENGEIPAKATGKFMHSSRSTKAMPCVGDWVCIDYHNSKKYASIHSMLPRKTFLRRKTAGKSIGFQMIAANIDVAFIVQSCHYDFNVGRLERYLVMANEGGVEPLIILSKIDLITATKLEQLILAIREAGINTQIVSISNISGAGLEEFKNIMKTGKTYCIVGSSGVGKSTLINKITGSDTLRTQTVSNSGEGRHTTVRRQLIVLEHGAMLIDTPGMREVGILAANDDVEDNFDDIVAFSLSCRFNNCKHTNEPDCAIIKAIEEGILQLERYQNYAKLMTESKSYSVSHGKKQKNRKPSRIKQKELFYGTCENHMCSFTSSRRSISPGWYRKTLLD